jgi:hypothetical protein
MRQFPGPSSTASTVIVTNGSKSARAARRLKWAGVVVLAVGLAAALTIYRVAPARSSGDAANYNIVGGQVFASPDENSAEMQQVERLGGKPAVYALEFHRWFLSLWHGRRLAWTLIVLCVAVALLCFHLAGLMADEPDG